MVSTAVNYGFPNHHFQAVLCSVEILSLAEFFYNVGINRSFGAGGKEKR